MDFLSGQEQFVDQEMCFFFGGGGVRPLVMPKCIDFGAKVFLESIRVQVGHHSFCKILMNLSFGISTINSQHQNPTPHCEGWKSQGEEINLGFILVFIFAPTLKTYANAQSFLGPLKK